MKKISKYLLLLAAAVFTFTACEKNVEREPSPLDVPGAIAFTSPGANVKLNMSKDPLETTVTLFRTSNLDKADTIKVSVLETHPVFVLDPVFIFAPGDKQVSQKVTFATGEADSTYTFQLALPENKVSPYLAGNTTFTYTVKLELWSEPRTGVWVDDAVVSSTFTSIPPSVAWTVSYQVVELADGSMKLRIINPYACTASAVDANGVYDGFPYNEAGDWDTSKDYNIELFIDAANDVTMPDVELGVDWGHTMMKLVNYKGVVAHGDFDPDAQRVLFDKNDNKNSLVFAMDKPYNYAGYRFYLSYAAYLADQEEPEPVEATVETYEGTWEVTATDGKTGAAAAPRNITIVSGEDPEQGQFYTISGLSEDLPEVYGYFDEETKAFMLGYNDGVQVTIGDKTYDATLYPFNSTSGKLDGHAAMKFVPAEDGSIVLADDSEAIGFGVVYFNVADESDYVVGDVLLNLNLAAVDAASAPAKAAPRAKKSVKTLRHMVNVVR